MQVMLFMSLGVDQDVTDIYYGEDIQKIPEDIVCHVLKNCRCICETERYNYVLEVTISSTEYRLPFKTRLYALIRSSFLKYLSPLRRSNKLDIKGRAYLFRTVILFIFW